MTDLDKARALLDDGSFGNCVLYGKGGTIHASRAKGITPVLEFLEAGLDLKDFSAADTVAGKALALLYAFAGIKSVFARVMSESAVEVFRRHEIHYIYDELVPAVKNRRGDGVCPMEQAIAGVDEPAKAFEILKKIVAELSGK